MKVASLGFLLGLIFLLSTLSHVTLAGTPSQWRNRVIYQVLVDRFARGNGDTSACAELHDYCGGDLQGMINHLDYLTELGVDSVWISPLLENFEHGYHGYWAKNLYKPNLNFGDDEMIKKFIEECHKRDIWVMIDVVANHIGRGIEDVPEVYPFNSMDFFHDCIGCVNCSVANYTDEAQMLHCRLFGLPDLNQTMPIVHDTLLDWIGGLMNNYSFDGVRIDTVPYVEKPFWKEFTDRSGAYTLGEVADGRADYVSRFQGYVDGLFNFPMYYTLLDVFRDRQTMWKLHTRNLELAGWFPDLSLLANFIENHDQPRFMAMQPDIALYRSALLYVLTSQGIPVIYYGSEQAYSGGQREPTVSEDPSGGSGGGGWDVAYNREPLWSSGFATKNSWEGMFAFVQTVLKLRSRTKYYLEAQEERFVSDDVYAFSRGRNLIVLTNRGSVGRQVEQKLSRIPFQAGERICNIFHSDECLTVDELNTITVYLNHGECKLYTLASQANADSAEDGSGSDPYILILVLVMVGLFLSIVLVFFVFRMIRAKEKAKKAEFNRRLIGGY